MRRIDALFEIEREINGKSPEERLAVRRAESQTLVDDLVTYMRGLCQINRNHHLAHRQSSAPAIAENRTYLPIRTLAAISFLPP